MYKHDHRQAGSTVEKKTVWVTLLGIIFLSNVLCITILCQRLYLNIFNLKAYLPEIITLADGAPSARVIILNLSEAVSLIGMDMVSIFTWILTAKG